MHLGKSLFVLIALMSLNAVAGWKPLPDRPEIPQDNPQTPAKIELGKMLFFDARLSKDGTVSCHSCHNLLPETGAVTEIVGRDSPSVWNSAYNTVQFWDGRAVSLENVHSVETGVASHLLVVDGIKKIPKYVAAFKKVFPNDSEPTIINASKALAAFERTLITLNSPFDKYLKGNKKALTAQQIRGMKLVDEIGCTSCHTGANLNGDAFKMGEGNFQPFPQVAGSKYDSMYDLKSDLGRFEITKKAEDKNYWRIPTWRNVAKTAPYFHNGKVKTLEEAVRVMAKTQIDTELNDDQVADIVAFLNSLTGTFQKMKIPILPNP